MTAAQGRVGAGAAFGSEPVTTRPLFLPSSRIEKLLYLQVRKAWAYGYVIFLCVLYTLVRVHTPMAVYAGAPHDDTLFMSLGQSLAEGHWLGPYNELTLAKGPGFPLFLALCHWLGISVSLGIALFHCLAITTFCFASHRLIIRSQMLSGALFTLLLWHPIALTVYLLRVYRETIYYAQGLLFLGLALIALFPGFGRRQRLLAAMLCGLTFGWFWLTREEGVWIVPGLAIIVTGAFLKAWYAGQIRTLVATLALVLVAFLTTQATFRGLNKIAYFSFVGVDFKETNYSRALKAIHSVRSGGNEPWVSITTAARARVYAVSPHFAELRDYLDGPPGLAWAKISCANEQSSCTEIGAGFFVWALRHAAAGAGHFTTPADASRFFGQVADEINAACARGGLECSPQLVAAMPQVRWQDIVERFPAQLRRAASLPLLRNPPLQINGSSGADLHYRLRFLNYPIPMRHGDTASLEYSMSGWYYKTGTRDFFTPTVREPNGTTAVIQLKRVTSPDLVGGLKEPIATDQRYSLWTRCHDECVMRIEAADGTVVEKTLGELRRTPIGLPMGGGHFVIDQTTVKEDPTYLLYRTDRIANAFRLFDLKIYEYVFLPILFVGLLAFLWTTLFHWRTAALNLSYVLALASMVLVASSVGLLLLMGLTANNIIIIKEHYAAPAFFHLVCVAIFSIAAWLQLARPDPGSAGGG